MLEKISFPLRRNILTASTSLVVCFVRTYLQYHRYGWESLTHFFGSWIIHYIAILLLIIITHVFFETKKRLFLEPFIIQNGKEMSNEESQVYICLTLLVLSIGAFFIAHFPESDDLFDN